MAYQTPPSTASPQAVAYFNWVKSQRVPLRTRGSGFDYIENNEPSHVTWDEADTQGALLLGEAQ